MNKILREVGFLAIGVAAVLEIAIYYRWWSWDGHFAEPNLVALFILLQGIYFFLDGLTWQKLEEEITLPGRKEHEAKRVSAETFYKTLAKVGTRTWYLDLAALIAAVLSLGSSTHLLASFEHSHGQIENHHKVLMGLIGFSLTTLYALSAIYWFFISSTPMRQETGASEFFQIAKTVWRLAEKSVHLEELLTLPDDKWLHYGVMFAGVTLITIILTLLAIHFGPTTWVLSIVNICMTFLIGGYLFETLQLGKNDGTK